LKLVRLLAPLIILAATVAFGLLMYLSDQRMKQRMSQADLRTLSIALGGYVRDHQSLPPAPSLLVTPRASVPTGDIHTLPPRAWPPSDVSFAEALAPFLVPRYVHDLPVADRWGCPILVAITTDLKDYTLVSRGRDCQLDPSHSRVFPPRELTRDLILANDEFISFPEGDKL
jgi:type II secretory pathway pseudopilin PulG